MSNPMNRIRTWSYAELAEQWNKQYPDEPPFTESSLRFWTEEGQYMNPPRRDGEKFADGMTVFQGVITTTVKT